MTRFMISYKQGEVVLISFPFTDLSSYKQRPGIVISSDKFNDTHRDVIIAAITSRIPAQISGTDYVLDMNEQKQAGLPKKSMVKMDKIVTLDQILIRKKLGHLPIHALKQSIELLHLILLND